ALQAKDSLFRAWVTELSFKKQVEFKRFSEPIVTSLKIAREWGKNQEVDLGDSAKINLYFMPTLKSLPQIHALIIANTDGQEYYLRRQGNEWFSRSCDPRRWPGKVLERSWRDGSEPGPGKLVPSDYDPRQRPWFKGCMAITNPDEVFWTPPYRFFSNGHIGVTAAQKWSAGEKSGLKYVVAFDVLISDLLAWTSELDLGPAGRAFMISDENRILGLPPDAPGMVRKGLPPVEKLIDMGFGQALKKWQRERISEEQVFSFRVDRKTWWAGFVPLKIGGRHLWLAVLIPEKDILQIASYRVSFFWIPLSIFIAGSFLFLLSFYLVRRHVASLEALHRENRRLVNDELAREASLDDPAARIRELIRAGESERLEFKSTVRWNLRENRAGKEIEIAWLKGVVGFLNTEGGVLLIGVEDDGTIAGIERDNFTNDDKCLRHIDSLISTHIGLEFSRYIHFAIIEVEGRKVVEIRCRLSENPAFLKKGDVEEFYIRTGPASRKLKPSQIIKYLASRKSDTQSQ
ncbi:MAG: hypothetical protein GXO34_01110, partial [Deltaproteobacteria bacterium]|nr:hypothetical protein [Deltaproteobacteria bacterium]